MSDQAAADAGRGAKVIAPADTKAMIQSGTEHAIFDVREYAEAVQGRIEVATVLPRRLFEFRIAALVPNVDTPTILYDGDDGRAILTAELLRSGGYRNVSVMAGGIGAWQSSGYPVVEGLNVMSKRFGEWVFHDDAVPEVDAKTLKKWLRDDGSVRLVDVRPYEEHVRGCVPGAENIAGIEIVRHAERWRQADTRVVTHCAGRTRGILAAASLRLAGVDAAVLQDGTQGWVLSGETLESPAAENDASVAAAREEREVAGVRSDVQDTVPRLAPHGLLKLLEGARTVYVMDVRTASEYTREHIEGARHVPGGQLIQAFDDHIAVAWATTVLVDEGEGTGRAEWTGYWLTRMGVPNLQILDGGMRSWLEAELPVAGGRPRWAVLQAPELGQVARLTAAGAREAMSGAVVLDVDTSDRFRAGHIPGAIWLLRSWLEREARTLMPDREGRIICYCHRHGRQGELAAATLRSMGYGNVAVLEGGMQAWLKAGFPVDRDASGHGPSGDVIGPPHEEGEAAMLRYLAWEKELDGQPHRSLGETVWSRGRSFD